MCAITKDRREVISRKEFDRLQSMVELGREVFSLDPNYRLLALQGCHRDRYLNALYADARLQSSRVDHEDLKKS